MMRLGGGGIQSFWQHSQRHANQGTLHDDGAAPLWHTCHALLLLLLLFMLVLVLLPPSAP
jgi:hypothetical protein